MRSEAMSPDQILEGTRTHKVTVVVPAYNSADTLPRALESLQAQTSSDFCVLVIDDGSDEEILELMPDDPRFFGHRLHRNQGYAAVTNHALDMSASTWVLFLDSDDSLDPECIEVLVARGEAENSDFVVLPHKTFEPTGSVSVHGNVATTSPVPAGRALRHFIDGRVHPNQHHLFRPNHVRAKPNTYSDLGFIVNLLATMSTVSFEPRPMYNYFLLSDSVTAQLSERIWDLATVLADVEGALRTTYTGREAVEAIHRMRWTQLNYMLSKAAGDTSSPRLKADVYFWCRNEIRFSHVVDALRTRQAARGFSMALARVAPRTHSYAYRLRGSLKERWL